MTHGYFVCATILDSEIGRYIENLELTFFKATFYRRQVINTDFQKSGII